MFLHEVFTVFSLLCVSVFHVFVPQAACDKHRVKTLTSAFAQVCILACVGVRPAGCGKPWRLIGRPEILPRDIQINEFFSLKSRGPEAALETCACVALLGLCSCSVNRSGCAPARRWDGKWVRMKYCKQRCYVLQLGMHGTEFCHHIPSK